MTSNKSFCLYRPTMLAKATNSTELRRGLPPMVAPVTLKTNDASTIQARIALFDKQGQLGPSYPVEVKDFDERGIAFDHRLPLTDRRAMVTLEGPGMGRLVAEVDLGWCRFNRGGQYTSGGRFVRVLGKTA